MPPRLIVLDTNIVLDAFVFSDAAAAPLRARLEDGALQWIATAAMRDELARVLGYKQIVPRLALYRLAADDVLAAFDRHARPVDDAPRAMVTCSDPDDQKFIDLAVAHQSQLLSKDRAILCMARRLLALDVGVGSDIGSVVSRFADGCHQGESRGSGAMYGTINGRGSARTAPG